MPGRPKIQFKSEQAGDEFWQLYIEVSELRHKQAEAKAAKLRREHPELTIDAQPKPMAAGPLVLTLMRDELARLKGEECATADHVGDSTCR